MRKGLLVFLLIVCFSLVSWAQKHLVDSMLMLESHLQGTELAELYVNLSNAAVYHNTSNALEYAQKGYELADGLRNDSLKYAALKAMGYANGYLGRFETSLQNMKDGLEYYTHINDSVRIAEALSDVAYLLQAMNGAQTKIMEYNLKALKIREKIGDEKGIAYSLNNIGALFWEWEKYELAVDYFIKALPYFQRLHLIEEQAFANANIGEYYITQKSYFNASKYFQRALEQFVSIDHDLGTSAVYSGLTKMAINKENYEAASDYNAKAMQIRKRLGDREGLAGCYFNQGIILMHQKQYYQAKDSFVKSLKLSREIGLFAEQANILENLAEVNYLTGNAVSAYQNLKESHAINDSIFNAEKHRQIEELRTQYDSEKKENENLRLQAENEAQETNLRMNRFILILSSALGIIFTLFVILFYQRRINKGKIRRLESEQRLIRSQMNPHFIFNSITAIQNYIFNHSSKEAMSYLSSFAKLMRQILEGSRQETILLEDEVSMLKNYLELQKIRYIDRFEYRIVLDETIQADKVIVPPMLNQPFLENAIEHGLKNVDYMGSIRIEFQNKQNHLKVVIEDNGIGLLKGKKERITVHRSFAVEATQKRLKAIAKQNNLKYAFSIIDKSEASTPDKGTRVEYNLPLIPVF